MDEDTLTPEYCLILIGMKTYDHLRTLDNKCRIAGVPAYSDFSGLFLFSSALLVNFVFDSRPLVNPILVFFDGRNQRMTRFRPLH